MALNLRKELHRMSVPLPQSGVTHAHRLSMWANTIAVISNHTYQDTQIRCYRDGTRPSSLENQSHTAERSWQTTVSTRSCSGVPSQVRRSLALWAAPVSYPASGARGGGADKLLVAPAVLHDAWVPGHLGARRVFVRSPASGLLKVLSASRPAPAHGTKVLRGRAHGVTFGRKDRGQRLERVLVVRWFRIEVAPERRLKLGHGLRLRVPVRSDHAWGELGSFGRVALASPARGILRPTSDVERPDGRPIGRRDAGGLCESCRALVGRIIP